jgi:hypothetical protein
VGLDSEPATYDLCNIWLLIRQYFLIYIYIYRYIYIYMNLYVYILNLMVYDHGIKIHSLGLKIHKRQAIPMDMHELYIIITCTTQEF